jgi:precorrin-3B synthase
MLRVRIPGGRVGAPALRALSTASANFADGDIQLTSRANLQLRGVLTGDGSALAGLADELALAGLVAHPTHERVRNILCSPLTGLIGGLADLRTVVADLDDALCATSELAELPGPFLFALDDGRGDIGVRRADLAAVAVDRARLRIWVGGRPGPTVRVDRVVPTLLELAQRFRLLAADAPAERPVWHVRELPGAGTELLGHPVGSPAPPPAGGPVPLGALTQDDGSGLLSVLAPLGRLTGPQVTALGRAASVGVGELIVTPWRGVLVAGLPPAVAPTVLATLIRAGLVADDRSPWRGITACAGTRCARGTGDTAALAGQVVAASPRPAALPVHIVACVRACGRPTGRHVLAVLDRSRAEIRCGYTSVEVGTDDAAAGIVALRSGAAR